MESLGRSPGIPQMPCSYHMAQHQMFHDRDFPGDPVVRNPPCNAGDMGSIPGKGTKVPPETKPAGRKERSHVPLLTPDAAK